MTPKGTLIIVDDNKNILTSLRYLLANYFERIITLSSPVTLLSVAESEKADVILLDMNFRAGINSGNEGLYWLDQLKKSLPEVEVVLFTAYADIQLAVNGIKNGAFDFVVKPWDNARLIDTLTKAAKSKSCLSHNNVGKSADRLFWGSHQSMLDIKDLVEKIAPTDANVLITGENGVGKDLIAEEIHRLSLRHSNPIVKVDMGAVTDTLFESEMFGYEKGAFTDAKAMRIGRIESADGGTLFLDEIGNLPLPQQAKLLTVLQQRAVVRVGANKPLPVNVRVISATNKNLSQMVIDGEFRQDLMYRINTITIDVPPLRSHPSDILPLARIFLRRYADAYNREKVDNFDDDAVDALKAYPWPGNIRELQHAVEKAVILCANSSVSAQDLDLPRISTASLVSGAETLEEMERLMIVETLKKNNNNLSAVAAKLGISRQTLYNKMKRFGL